MSRPVCLCKTCSPGNPGPTYTLEHLIKTFIAHARTMPKDQRDKVVAEFARGKSERIRELLRREWYEGRKKRRKHG